MYNTLQHLKPFISHWFSPIQDLQHPNEFIRGSTLRFLCKLKEPELLEPLMPAIRACLDHRHSYVRRNAVLAIFTIYRYSKIWRNNIWNLIMNNKTKTELLLSIKPHRKNILKKNMRICLFDISPSVLLKVLHCSLLKSYLSLSSIISIQFENFLFL